MEVRPETVEWSFRADFLLQPQEELKAKRAVLGLGDDRKTFLDVQKIFNLPSSFVASTFLVGGASYFIFGNRVVFEVLRERTLLTLAILLAMELAIWALLYWLRSSPDRSIQYRLSRKLEAERRVVFEGDGKGFSWKADGALVNGTWDRVDGVWSSDFGLAIVRAADIAFVPRRVFATEADFVSTIDSIMRLAQPNDPIRIDR